MEPTQPTASEQNVYAARPASTGKLPVTISLLVACLVFFLPFIEIKCNGTPLAQASGLDLAMGFDMKPTGSMKSLSELGNSTTGQSNNSVTTKKQEPNIFAIAALGFGILAFLLAFVLKPGNKIIGVISVFAMVALIVLMVDVKSHIKDEASKEPDSMGMGVKITADFTMWYFLSVLGFGFAAVQSFRKRKVIVQPTVVATPVSASGTSLNVSPPGESGGSVGNG